MKAALPSMRRSLLLRTGIATALVLISASVVLYELVASDLSSQFDMALLSKARLLASTVEDAGERIELEFGDLDMGEFSAPMGPGFLQLWKASGESIFRSASLQRYDLPRPEDGSALPTCRRVRLPAGQWARAVFLTFQPRKEETSSAQPDAVSEVELRLTLARVDESIMAALQRFRLLLIGLTILALLVMSATLIWAVRTGLAPVDALGSRIARIGEHDLGTRIEEAGLPREILPVVSGLNDMLARLDDAFEREKELSADVAHELRTPLAGLRTTLEVGLTQPRSTEAYQATLSQCLSITERLQSMVENLLALARIEADAWSPARQEVRPTALIREQWEPLREVGQRRGIDVQWRLGSDALLRTDPGLLGIAIRNILDNAVTYIDAGGTLSIDTQSEANGWALSVANTGSELSTADARNLCGRFRRGDASRSETGHHCGLGLYLTQEILRILGGSLEIQSEVGGRYRAILRVPIYSQ